MKFTHFLLALLTMVSAFAFVTWKRLSVNLEEELSTHATLINEEVPKVLNPHTDLIGARADGREIVYLFRVHGFSAETMARPGVSDRSCGDSRPLHDVSRRRR